MNLLIKSVKTFEDSCYNSHVNMLLHRYFQQRPSWKPLWPNLCPLVKPSPPAKNTVWKIFTEKHLIVYSMVMTMHHILRPFIEAWPRTGAWLSKMSSWEKTVTGGKSKLGASGQDTVSSCESISKNDLGSGGHEDFKCNF